MDSEKPSPDALAAPGPDDSQRRAKRQYRKRVAIPLIALGIVLIAAALGWVQHKGSLRAALSELPFVSPDLTQVFGKQKLRVLVMGVDENWTDSDEMYTNFTRSDTMMAVMVDLPSHQIGVLSIPRDLWVYIPKSGYGKINEAIEDGGPQRAEITAQKNLGTPPFDYYIVLKIDATKNIVDALGGLDVKVEKDMDYDDSWGHLHIHLKKGFQHLSGEQVVEYIRFRHDPEGDFGRMRRQRQVIQDLIKRVKTPSIVLRLPELLNIVQQNVRTDMPADKMLYLAEALKDETPQMVHTGQIPANVGWTDGESVLYADDAATQALVHKFLVVGFNGQFDPSTVHVAVHNGSGRPGAASALADFLRQRGFTIVETGNAKSFNVRTTKVEGPDQKIVGEVARELPVSNPQLAIGQVDGGDVDIIVGQDYRAQ